MSADIKQDGGASAGATAEQSCLLSKSQLKKLRKREKWLATRGERRQVEKQKRKAKRKAAAEERAKLGLDNVVVPKIRMMSESNNKFRVVIDMDFEEHMTDAEISASVKQVGRIYSINRHDNNPCQLHISSLKGKILQKFSSINTGYKSWDCNISELDYSEIFKTDQIRNSETHEDEPNRKQFIYLTGDAGDDLPDVEEILKDESRIFVIGGLVDHNRHKKLCYQRALEKNIPTARLPIAQYVKLSHRNILSTVTVFEIMLKILGSHKSWPAALLEAIPKRKLAHPNVVDASKNSLDLDKKDVMDAPEGGIADRAVIEL